MLETKADSNASYVRRVLLKFDTNTTIPAGTPIASAYLTITVSGGGSDSRQLSAFHVTNSYDEAAVTWNSRKAGLAWSQPGGDRGARYDIKPVPSAVGSQMTFDVTAMVQAIVRGDFGSSRYTRVLLVDEGSPASTSYKSFYSDITVRSSRHSKFADPLKSSAVRRRGPDHPGCPPDFCFRQR